MATTAHCLFCIEQLVAKLHARDTLSLAQIEELWSEYSGQSEDSSSTGVAADEADNPKPVAPQPKRNLLNSSPGASSSPSPSSTPSAASNASSSLSVSSSRSSLSSSSQSQSLARKLRSNKQLSAPVFVTYNTIGRHGSKSLRGCIGTFEAQPIEDNLRTYALTSAFEDTRFPPISKSELQSLECSVTLLTDFEPAPAPLGWEIGKHGLRISFTYHGRRYGATYLPDVAREQGWTKDETMVSLMRKAGWSGRRDEWMDVADLHVVRYQGSRTAISYKDWRAFREWVADKMNNGAA